jgi:hypothetical protein
MGLNVQREFLPICVITDWSALQYFTHKVMHHDLALHLGSEVHEVVCGRILYYALGTRACARTVTDSERCPIVVGVG